jgi:hypothetical protein
MKTRIGITSLLAGAVLLLGSAAMAGQPKIVICHRPPGNPAKFHKISVAAAAVPGHLRKGANLFGPEQCGDGIDNDCDGEVDDPGICSGTVHVGCRCLYEDGNLTLTRCLSSGALCRAADLCEPFCIEDFGFFGIPLLGTELVVCEPLMCNP